jgi:hypothetical protein
MNLKSIKHIPKHHIFVRLILDAGPVQERMFPEPGVVADRRLLEGKCDPLAVKEREQGPNQARLKTAVPLDVKTTPWL